MSYDVFISHGSADRAVAEAACEAIERAGHLCWLAPRDLGAGEAPEAASAAAISRAKVFLLVLSGASADLAQVAGEAERAQRAGLGVVLLRIEAVEPGEPIRRHIAGAETLDALQSPLPVLFDDLNAIVGRMLEGGEGAPLRPLTQPPRPMPRLRRPMPAWLPIAIAGAVGVAAIAVVAAMAAR